VPKPKQSATEQLSGIADTVAPLSSGTKTALMAFGAFVIVFAAFGPARPPDHRSLYTGCELSGAIKRCDEFGEAVANGWVAVYWRAQPLPRITGAPSTEDQITALTWQDNWFSEKRRDEEQVARQEHDQKIYRQEYERRGVNFEP
jgi:hypothetical protein